ncbi:MAG TPA: two-component regulator propeller domain-containing protein [Verrucomicrobiae bacterium]
MIYQRHSRFAALALIAWLACAGVLFAHERTSRYLIDSWQTDQGLPQNSVISMTQSHDGYLWLATFNGLVRFDGVRFTVFNSHNTPALESSRVVRVWEDQSGCLWIGTESGGLTRRIKGVFEPIQSSKPAQLQAICDGALPGEVWLTLVDGRLLHFVGGKLEQQDISIGGQFVAALAPLHANDGRILLWTEKGIFTRKNDSFAPADAESLKYSGVGDVFAPSSKGGSWRTFDGKILRIDHDQIVESHPATGWLVSGIAALFEDHAGNLWIGTLTTGLARISANGHREILGDEYGLGHAQVRCIFEDRENNMWIGTDGGGLYRLRVGAFSVIDKTAGLGADVTLAVTENENGLWIGTNGGGLAHVDDEGVEILNASGLPIVHVWTLLEDREKSLWVGTWGAGAFKKTHGRFEAVPELNTLGGIILASFEEPSGALWFGGPSGLARISKAGVKVFTHADGLSHDDTRAITDDGEGGLWIGSNGGGLNHYKHGKFSALRHKDGLADDTVWSLYRDKENTLWIGTFGGGLSVLRNGKITTFTTQDGLPSAVICSITEDASGYLWMGSYSGVFRVKKAQLLAHQPGSKTGLDFFVFTKSDGLPSRECTGGFQPAVCKADDGHLVFPTVKGVAIVDPNNLPFNPKPPEVVIEEAEIDNSVFALDPAPAVFKVPPSRTQVEFRYTALSFSAPEKVRFRYKMEGLDKEWQDPGARRSAYYSHLPPGDYKFHVIASNNDGVWNNTGSILAVQVIPAFWQTWWFLAACVLMVGGLIAGSIRYIEVRKLQQRMQLLEQQHAVERERARIAKDIHDDLGASLTQITLLSELARTDLQRPTEAESHIRQISGTARELTRAMDEIVWAVNPQNDTLEDLLTYTVKFAQEHLGLARIRCRLDVPAHLPPLHLSAEIRHNLFLAIKEAINNVAKHSKATEAWLRLRTFGTSFVFEIEDNGCGIPAGVIAGRAEDFTTPGSHNGLRNMERRLREIGGAFEIAPGRTCGTLIRMRVDA